MKLVTALQLAGLLHLGLLAAGLTMPHIVNLRSHLAVLPSFIRRLFWVYYGFIGMCLLSFGGLSVLFAPDLASGTALARAICGFLALFWTIRSFVAVFVFDVRPYLTTPALKFGFHATNAVFLVLPFIYSCGAMTGGSP
jgi:hypothetical protein